MDTLFANVNMKGQIVIPAELRDELKIRPGTKIAIQREGGAIVLQPITDEFLASIPGSLKRKGYESLGRILDQERHKEAARERRRLGENRS